MKIAFEYLDYENTFGATLIRSATEYGLCKFHFLVNFWKFVLSIHFAKWHSKKEYWELRRNIGYEKEIGCCLWHDDDGWHLVFDLWLLNIYFDRCGVMNWRMHAYKRKIKAR